MSVQDIPIVAILQGTPLWVFALLGVLVVLGIQALKPRIVPLWRLPLVPAVFIVWGLTSLGSRTSGAPLTVLYWLAAGAAGMAIACSTTRFEKIQIDRAHWRVSVPGSPVPLLRNLTIFAAKYGIAVAIAMAPQSRAHLLPWDLGISGLSAGYFVFWLIGLVARYRNAPAAEPVL